MIKPIVLIALLLFGVVIFTSVANGEVHTGDLHNCENYADQAEAQAHYRENPTDPDDLDHDNDRVACEESLDCPCDFLPVPQPSNTPAPGPTRTPTPLGGAGGGGAGALGPPPGRNNSPAINCVLAYGCGTSCGIAYCPPYDVSAPSRPDFLALKVTKTSVACNEATTVIARVLFGNGLGAPAHLVTFQATQGTAFTNLLTDSLGYVATTYVAPSTPAAVTLTAFADGIIQMETISVACSGPSPAPPPSAAPIAPPHTGDGGLSN